MTEGPEQTETTSPASEPRAGTSRDPKLHKPGEIACRFAEAWNAADAGALAELFAPDADFVNVVGLWFENRRRIRAAHDYGFRRIFGASRMSLERIKTRDLGPDVAVVHALWTLTGQTLPGHDSGSSDPESVGTTREGAPEAHLPAGTQSEAGERRGVFTFVMHRHGAGDWQCVAAQNTDRIPGAETLTSDDGGLRPATYQS
ncbi:YybH family protein [Nesterenkonia flava]|uniref:SgcJ/EcaC family oxidoreductase n=1 Tax=Nesterenkonia flava TaxID=469799 RepID=A0ABU1FTV1_9MICC|nr:SgcJ/EcaC family oxidoreductase [Nesterenkonia flava]MDR5712093.1 SgcJ/EcaC family oxidoreductase [Nesterenkonia flava]